MKNQILYLVAKYPKHYSMLIKRDIELRKWVEENSLLTSGNFVSMIYSAVNQVTNQCENGNLKKFDRWATGFVGCGPANKCSCTKAAISKGVSSTKQRYDAVTNQLINEKRSSTMLGKYNVQYNSQRQDIKSIWTKPKIPAEALEKLTNKEWLQAEYVTKQRTSVDIAKELNVYYSTVASYCIDHGFTIRRRSNYSMTEVEIKEFIESLGLEVESSNYSILKNKEIDLYVPSKNIGIEVNGLYWHSFSPKQKLLENVTRHLDKTTTAESFGANLLHITDWEWNNQREIIKSMLRAKLGVISTIIPARKCTIAEVNSKTSREFLNENHLQGYTASAIKLGLFRDNELLMLITAGHNRFRNKEIELHRLCSKKNTIVSGGASKLLAHLKQKIKQAKIISYCDRSKSSGQGYINMGFTLLRATSPGYFWTDGTEIISRYKCNRTNLKKWLKTYDSNLSESANMFTAGYRRYWDCGNLVFEL